MNPSSIRFQTITTNNASLLDHLLEGVFDYPIQADSLQKFLSSPTHHLRVALNNESKVIGFISYVDIFHPDKQTQVFINELSVHEDYQRLGIATTLMNHVFEYAKDHAYYVWVATEMDNPGADAFYQRLSPDSRQDSWYYDWHIKKDR